MRSMQEAVGYPLLWRRRGFLSRTYELSRADEEPSSPAGPFATLRWREAFIVGRSRAELVSAAGSWRLVPEGLLGHRVRIVTEAGEPAGSFQHSFRSGLLRLEDGREFHWGRTSWLSQTWHLQDANGIEVVRFRTRLGWLRTLTTVEIEAAVPAADRALLAGFGYYLVRRSRAAARRTA
jgi:hypothetical protein